MIGPTSHVQSDLDVSDLSQDIDAPLGGGDSDLGELTLTKIDFDEIEVSLDL